VEPGRFDSTESAIEKNLPGGGCEKIRPAHDLGDTHGDVIDDHGEFVGRDVVAVPNEEIPEIAQGGFFNEAKIFIPERNGFAIGNTEAPVHTGGLLERLRFAKVSAPLHGEDRLLLMRGEG
jgi:hypothetical protein